MSDDYRVRCTDCGMGRPEVVSLAEAKAWERYHMAMAPKHHVEIVEEDRHE